MEENIVKPEVVMALNAKFANLVTQKEKNRLKLKSLDLKRFKNN